MNESPHITLFNDAGYQSCNIVQGQRLFRYDHMLGNSVTGTLSGVISNDLLDCGHSAPFGGVDCVRPAEMVGKIVDLLHAAAARAKTEGIRIVRIRARPGYFGPNEFASEFALLNMGASVESCEFSLALEAWRYNTPDAYQSALKREERRILRRSGSGTNFQSAGSLSEWADCYALIAETKRRRGVELKISLEYVLALREIFGARIKMYRLSQGTALVAAALVYRIAPKWDYVAAWGDDRTHGDNKIMNILSFYLMSTAIAQRVSLVDLGISSVDGAPDDQLILFKRNIGAASGLRINFILPLQ